jgi:uncharacterized protein YcbX
LHVAELWVYPVKSLAGERIERTRLSADGVPGDRAVQVRDGDDRLLTARTRHALLRLCATRDERGGTLVEGHPWQAPEAQAALREAAGEDARLVPMEGIARFDDTPLLIATDGALAALGIDGRRLRPNVVIGGVEGLAERDWPGRRLRAGGAVIAVEKLCKRCVIPTVDPDTLAVTPGILGRINADFGGRFALNCLVEQAGPVALGDPVELL